MTTVIVLAKAPVPGRVKTRLSPPFTPAQAARLAEAALADTLETVLSTASANPVLALDGEPGAWLPPGLTVTPQITPVLLTPDWTGADALLGPAHDGGFWALGFREPEPATVRRAVLGVPMSRHDTGPVQLARLRAAGLRTRL